MRCFVIMPFGNPTIDTERARRFDSIYSQWIKPAVESIRIPGKLDKKIECHRADKISRPGEIITHIIENLIDSEIVIADLTERNPNVFYELGVRHAVNNNTILIADDLNDIPFDLRPLRTIIYRYEPESMLALRNSLENAISEILQEPEKIDNPVRRFLYNRDVDKLVKQSTSSESAVIRTMLSEMASLRTEFKEQTNELRQIIKLVTASKGEEVLNREKHNVDLGFFEGVWKNEATESVYYARVVNGELLIPYCYGNRSTITGHYHHCRLIGETLFGRFEWFNSPISGYAFLKVESRNRLVGGWWYKEDLPHEVLSGALTVNENIPGMVRYTFKRSTRSKKPPTWALEYFKRME